MYTQELNSGSRGHQTEAGVVAVSYPGVVWTGGGGCTGATTCSLTAGTGESAGCCCYCCLLVSRYLLQD